MLSFRCSLRAPLRHLHPQQGVPGPIFGSLSESYNLNIVFAISLADLIPLTTREPPCIATSLRQYVVARDSRSRDDLLRDTPEREVVKATHGQADSCHEVGAYAVISHALTKIGFVLILLVFPKRDIPCAASFTNPWSQLIHLLRKDGRFPCILVELRQ